MTTDNPSAPSPVSFINIITLKPGKLDEFIAIQTTELPKLAANISGFRESRLHRSLDKDRAVMIATFDTIEDHKRWVAQPEFIAHRARLAPLIESVDNGYGELVYEGRRP
ncbi:antibiotic biosynthesis monooxygenase family protein [Terrarubrum flagellatum]|uniref:antibiotic biosynthesis monooxygenase family protein n=1 Tax=Terrirubrum flagellatum TaxID=2895980 RepID=UPI003144E914